MCFECCFRAAVYLGLSLGLSSSKSIPHPPWLSPTHTHARTLMQAHALTRSLRCSMQKKTFMAASPSLFTFIPSLCYLLSFPRLHPRISLSSSLSFKPSFTHLSKKGMLDERLFSCAYFLNQASPSLLLSRSRFTQTLKYTNSCTRKYFLSVFVRVSTRALFLSHFRERADTHLQTLPFFQSRPPVFICLWLLLLLFENYTCPWCGRERKREREQEQVGPI